MLCGGGAADETVRRQRLHLQSTVLALQRRLLQRSLDHQQQPIGLEWLFQEVVGAALDGADRGFDVAVAGNHDHRQVGVEPLDQVKQFQPVHAAAGHPDVEHQQRGLAGSQAGQRRLGIGGRAHLIALILQDARHQFADVRLVVDHQDISRHCRPHAALAPSVCVCRAVFIAGSLKIARAPGAWTASVSTNSPPWSSRMRLTIARPRPVPFSRVVT